MKHASLLLAVVLALSACTVSVGNGQEDNEPVNAGTAEQQKSVLAAAHRVADYFDQGRFDEAWVLTGPMLRSQTNRAVFSSGIKVMRKSLGKADRRTVKGFNFPKAIDGVVDDFGLIAIQTDFENAKGVEEKFVFQKVGSEWKLAGYWLSRKVAFGKTE